VRPKVFCIGFHKTGTTSLAVALKALGYRVTGPNGVRDPDIRRNALPMATALVDRFDAFRDNPWPLLYREMDLAYPGSKFILTLRSSDSWIRSQVRHFGEGSTPMREWIYGVGHPKGNEQTYVQVFERHTADVLAWFSERPSDLLVMDLAAGDGWQRLCPFLGKEAPDIAFPHANPAGERENAGRSDRNFLGRLKDMLRMER
jgi:hypothetical protein